MKDISRAVRLAVFGAALVSLRAESTVRMVHGVVMDRQSHPLDHAVVQIENDWTMVVRSYITNAKGQYHFAELNPDVDYTLRAEYDGIRSSKRRLSKFDSHNDRQMNLTIHLGK